MGKHDILRDKLSLFAAHMGHIPRALSLVLAATGKWTWIWLALIVTQGLLPIVTVYLTMLVVNRLVAYQKSDFAQSEFTLLLLPVILCGAMLLLAECLRAVHRWVGEHQAALLRDHISGLIHERSTDADMAFYEQPQFFDELYRARYEASYRPVQLLQSLGSLTQHAITLISMAAILVPFGWWLPLVLFISTLPALGVVVFFSIRRHEWKHRTTPFERRSWYYDWLLTDREPAAELRLFRLGDCFRGRYTELRSFLRDEKNRLLRSQAAVETAAATASLAVTGGAMLWLVWQTSNGGGEQWLGELAFLYQAFSQGQKMMRGLLNQVGQLYGNTLFLGNLFAFLEIEPTVVDAADPVPVPAVLTNGLSLRNVTFQYTPQGRKILDNFSLDIPAGKMVAVVGENGAGKSTLIKLLCRFYDPVLGAVQWDGIDVREFALADLRQCITVLFQEPVHYNDTVMENIRLGDRDSPERPRSVEEAAVAAGADALIAKLPRQYDQLLGNWFENATQLSTGEWQRIALARAFFRRSPVILLDEPTSAMDPWAEEDWLRRVRKLATDRTVLLITHRFTTAMYADEIHVIQDGRIIESGDHRDLIAKRGRYSESWHAQMIRHEPKNDTARRSA